MSNQWELTVSARYTLFIFPQRACFVNSLSFYRQVLCECYEIILSNSSILVNQQKSFHTFVLYLMIET